MHMKEPLARGQAAPRTIQAIAALQHPHARQRFGLVRCRGREEKRSGPACGSSAKPAAQEAAASCGGAVLRPQSQRSPGQP